MEPKGPIAEVIYWVNQSKMPEEAKAWIYALIDKHEIDEHDTVWIMPGSEHRGLPMSLLPKSYIIAGLTPNTRTYIKKENYRVLLQHEARKRGYI